MNFLKFLRCCREEIPASNEDVKEDVKEAKTECPSLARAKEISTKYDQISSCCNIISSVNKEEIDTFYYRYANGWKVAENNLANADIDIDLVYAYIERLALAKKESLECELICLTNK